jgi:predicted SnoaL-like aldol condensation-catalyzing enzyme
LPNKTGGAIAVNMKQILTDIYSDWDKIAQNLHHEFVIHSPGHNLIAGEKRGMDGVERHAAQMLKMTDGTFHKELQGTYLADDTWGMVVHHMTAQRSGMHLSMWGFGLWRFSDGKLAEHWEAVGDQEVWDRFWS